MELQINHIYTTVHINDMGIAIRNVWTVTGYDEKRQQYYGIPKTKRKPFYLPKANTETLFFSGTPLLTLESETGRFSGDACYIFVLSFEANKPALKSLLITNLNEQFNRFDLLYFTVRTERHESQPKHIFN